MTSRATRVRVTLEPLVALSRLFWVGPEARRAWFLTLGAFALALLDVFMQVRLNGWNRSFYDALEHKNATLIEAAAFEFLILVLLATATVMAATLCKILLQVAWRESLTSKAIAAWLSDQAFYRMTILKGTDFAPEHRIAEDIRLTIDPVVDLTIGFVSALVTAITFAGVLWTAGGATVVAGVTIPGFMVFVGIAYIVLITGVVAIVGGSYTQRIRERSEAEARFRYELTRLRENAESVALLAGERGEKRSLGLHLMGVSKAWTNYARAWTQMTWVTYANNLAAPILPLLLMAPSYLSGAITLGTVMQAATAFGIFTGALGWFTGNYAKLSEWFAAASRTTELLNFIAAASDGVANETRIMVCEGTDENLHLTNVSLHLQDGTVLIADAHLVIAPGEMVLVMGESGTGKSTLVRAIAGAWPWGSGNIVLPAKARIAFLPQRSYLPTGTLRAAITYPRHVSEVPEVEIVSALELVGLSHLVPSLDMENPWDRYLSGGEQQRLAFARVALHRPSLVILDEATSALDEANEARMMELFTHRLFATTVISVAHRPSLGRFHNRVVTIQRRPEGSDVQVRETLPSVQHRIRDALTRIARTSQT